MNETVAKANLSQKEDKCAICGQQHPEPKKEKFESTVSKAGWERDKSLVGIFDSGDAQRKSVYPGGSFPAPYPTEGHHCLAYTTFIKKGKDRCLRLNHFLNKVGFKVNQAENIIQLPGRQGTASPFAPATSAWPSGVKKEYKSLWASIDLAKPLQLHTGRHRGTYFATSDALYARMMTLASDPLVCEDETQQEFEDDLKTLVKAAVNHAFNCVAGASWVCHPEHLRIAVALYGKEGSHPFAYVHGSGRTTQVKEVGYPGTRTSPAPWPKVGLPTSPF